ncbi:hypothetical protein Chor_005666 [Crotalus horridus]
MSCVRVKPQRVGGKRASEHNTDKPRIACEELETVVYIRQKELSGSLANIWGYPECQKRHAVSGLRLVREFPYTPSPPGTSVAHPTVPTAVIGGVVGGASLVVVVAVVVLMVLRHRRHTFKGDYSTKKHVYGNGYSKAGIPQHHPPMAQNLQYPDDSDDEKKPGPLGSNSYEDEDDDGAGAERKHRSCPNKYEEDSKRPYFTVDEGEAHSEAYNERTLGFQYDPEQLDIADNMVSQNDGSFISKKECLPVMCNSSQNIICPDASACMQEQLLWQNRFRSLMDLNQQDSESEFCQKDTIWGVRILFGDPQGMARKMEDAFGKGVQGPEFGHWNKVIDLGHC